MKKRAIISVSDKSGIVEFAKGLSKLGIEIISTGGTLETLKTNGIDATSISEITEFPECFDGRVKTLHPKIHGGILALRDNKKHMDEMSELDIESIDFVVVNLYPFKETITKDGVSLEDAIENIDIGGPTMLRAAAKNYRDVVVVTDPSDYNDILLELNENESISLKTRYDLALKVFEYTAHYDALIADYLRDRRETKDLPEFLTLTYEKVQELRYGENPHQKAFFYREILDRKGSLVNAIQLHGKELSYNNINDTNGALDLLKEFKEPTVVAVKHANPCGVASDDDIYEAYKKAYESDPISIFGGIVTINREVDARIAQEINKIFIEIIVAPSYTEDALNILKKKKNIRILQLDNIMAQDKNVYDMKKVYGGLLIQDIDNKLLKDDEELKLVTKRAANKRELEDLLFAFKVVKHVKSNAIVVAKNNKTLGIGPGQVNRIWAVDSSIERGGDETSGGVLASDAFFPFPDSIESAAKAGIKAIIQPGGSIKDNESIKACNKHGIAMYFTGMRHFKH